jgi:hypothetical protein
VQLGISLLIAMQPSFSFGADGDVTASVVDPLSDSGERKTETGTYEIVSRDDAALTVLLTLDGETETNTITVVDGTHLRIQGEDEPIAIPLVRS